MKKLPMALPRSASSAGVVVGLAPVLPDPARWRDVPIDNDGVTRTRAGGAHALAAAFRLLVQTSGTCIAADGWPRMWHRPTGRFSSNRGIVYCHT